MPQDNPKPSVFTIPAEVYALLDPVEKIVIRWQAERGEVRIIPATKPDVGADAQ